MAGFWTAERVAVLIKLRGDGISYQAIADRLGTTKNSALSKGQREGLAFGTRATRSKAPKAIKIKLERRRAAPSPPTPKKLYKDKPDTKAPKPVPGVNIENVTNAQCRFPMWANDEISLLSAPLCGHPVETAPYCGYHHERSRRSKAEILETQKASATKRRKSK